MAILRCLDVAQEERRFFVTAVLEAVDGVHVTISQGARPPLSVLSQGCPYEICSQPQCLRVIP